MHYACLSRTKNTRHIVIEHNVPSIRIFSLENWSPHAEITTGDEALMPVRNGVMYELCTASDKQPFRVTGLSIKDKKEQQLPRIQNRQLDRHLTFFTLYHR